MKQKITLNDAKKFVKMMGLNMNKYKFSINDLKKGMNVELEHGKTSKLTNVTNNDIMMTGKIALAHLLEGYNYYSLLDIMEKFLLK
jgi:hypothetical protein